MDDASVDAMKDTARTHTDRSEVRAGIPLLLTMLAMGLLGALAARSLLDGGLVEWVAMIGVFAVVAHATGVVYGIVHSKVRGDGSEH